MNYDDDFYKIGKWLLIFAVVGAFLFIKYGDSIWAAMPLCSFKKVTGIECPGCGMTRAFVYFFRGKFAESFMYHPFVPYVIMVYVWFMVRTFLKKHFASLNLGNSKIIYLIYIGIAIIFVQWFVKLYIRFVF